MPLTLSEDSVLAVNTLGMAGVVGHTVLGFNPRQQQPQNQEALEALPRLMTVSGRTEEGVKEVVRKVRKGLQDVIRKAGKQRGLILLLYCGIFVNLALCYVL